MSLINDALKKAQLERNGKNAPAASNPDVSTAVTGGVAGGRRGVLVALVFLVLIGAGGAAYFSGVFDAAEPVASLPPKAAPKAPSPAVPPTKPAVVVVAEAKPEPAAPVVPAIPAPPPAPAPAAPLPAPAPVEVAAPAAPVAPKKDPAVEALVGLMNLSLVRKSTGRCVLDGSIYKVGELVKSDPLIKLEAVSDSGVVFTDAKGVRYEKNRN